MRSIEGAHARSSTGGTGEWTSPDNLRRTSGCSTSDCRKELIQREKRIFICLSTTNSSRARPRGWTSRYIACTRAARPGMVRHRRHSLPSLRFKMHHHPSEGAQCRGFYSWTQREGFFFFLRRMSPQPAQRGFSEVRKQTPPRKENRTWPLVSR